MSRSSLLKHSTWTAQNDCGPLQLHAWTPYYLDAYAGQTVLVTIETTYYGFCEWDAEQIAWHVYSPYTGRWTTLQFRDDVLEWLVGESVMRPYGSELIPA